MDAEVKFSCTTGIRLHNGKSINAPVVQSPEEGNTLPCNSFTPSMTAATVERAKIQPAASDIH